mgnify:CR=1 FL=1
MAEATFDYEDPFGSSFDMPADFTGGVATESSEPKSSKEEEKAVFDLMTWYANFVEENKDAVNAQTLKNINEFDPGRGGRGTFREEAEKSVLGQAFVDKVKELGIEPYKVVNGKKVYLKTPQGISIESLLSPEDAEEYRNEVYTQNFKSADINTQSFTDFSSPVGSYSIVNVDAPNQSKVDAFLNNPVTGLIASFVPGGQLALLAAKAATGNDINVLDVVAAVAGDAITKTIGNVLPGDIGEVIAESGRAADTAGGLTKTARVLDVVSEIAKDDWGEADLNVIYNIADATQQIKDEEEEEQSEQDAIDIAAAVSTAVDAITVPEDNPDVIAANDAVTAAQTAAQTASDNVATVIEQTDSAVASAEARTQYMLRTYGGASAQAKRARQLEKKAKQDARDKVNQAKTAESAAKTKYEDSIKLQQGTYRDAQDAYKVAQVKARRDAEADVQQRIAERKEQERIRQEADTDGDGIKDIYDLFPDDPNEWSDSDGDGVGDIAQALEEEARQRAIEEAAEQNRLAELERQRLEEEARKAREAEEEQEKVVVPVEPIEPPEDPPLDIPEPIIEPIEDPTTGSSGDEGTPATEPVEPVDDFEDPIAGDDPEFPWVYLGNGVFRHSKTGEELYDEQAEENPNYVVGSFYSGPKSSGEEEEDKDLPIVPSPFDDDDEDDFVTPKVDPPTFDPGDPIEDPVDPVEDPVGGAADTGTGVGDTGTGGGDGTGTGTGTGLGRGLGVGLAAGMLRPQAVTNTLFEDYTFRPMYQAPEPVEKATQYGDYTPVEDSASLVADQIRNLRGFPLLAPETVRGRLDQGYNDSLFSEAVLQRLYGTEI